MKLSNHNWAQGVRHFSMNTRRIWPCLSRKKDSDPRWAERFELYVNGLELANAFSANSPTQSNNVRALSPTWMKNRRSMATRWPIDEDFLAAMEHGMPECAGIALGVDRLVMLACGVDEIGDVLWLGV